VADPGLAVLAAAVAQEEMNRIDYRGPLRKQEVLMLLAGPARVALAVAVGLYHLGITFSDVGGSLRSPSVHGRKISSMSMTRESGYGVVLPRPQGRSASENPPTDVSIDPASFTAR